MVDADKSGDLLTSLPGFRSYYPEYWAGISFILNNMRDVSKKYGYEEYEGPSVERAELFEAKSGASLLDEIFKLSDKQERRLVLRPEQTPTLARMLAKEQVHYRNPIRWFSIPRLFRDETSQRGREREFWQLNVDILGEKSLVADAEVIAVGADIIRACGLKDNQFRLIVNHRGLLNNFIQSITSIEPQKIISIIDKKLAKLEKRLVPMFEDMGSKNTEAIEYAKLFRRILISSGEFKNKLLMEAPESVKSLLDRSDELISETMTEEYLALGLDEGQAAQIFQLTEINGHPNDFLDRINRLDDAITEPIKDEIKELEQLSLYLEGFGVLDVVVYDTSLARGLDYYTGIVFEAFDTTGEVVRAILGGGRYANLVEAVGGNELSGTGFGMGETVILELVNLHKQLPETSKNVDLYLAPIKKKPIPAVLKLASSLREHFDVECNAFPWKLNKHFDMADHLDAKLVILLGPKDLENGKVSVRIVSTAEQKTFDMDEALVDNIRELIEQLP